MLTEIRIKNFAIIDNLVVNFKPRLNVITGETGAGKSIIIDAISLLLGAKVNQDLIKTRAKESYIEAIFDNTKIPILERLGIDSKEGVILRRIISFQGKTKSSINDASVTLQTLMEVSVNLLDICSQNDYQSLLKKEQHLIFVDAIGGLQEEFGKFQNVFNDVILLKNNLSRLKQRFQEREQRVDFLKFQINEIISANLKEEEKETLLKERQIFLNLSHIKEATEMAYSLLYDSEGACLDKLSGVISKIKEIASFDNELIEPLNTIENVESVLKDVTLSLRALKSKYNITSNKISNIEDRLDIIRGIEKKYGSTVKEVLDYKIKAEDELKSLENIDEKRKALEDELLQKELNLKVLADELSVKRNIISKKIEDNINEELKEIGFQKSEFKIKIQKLLAIISSGIDEIEFLFSANPGELPKSLINVASGGEVSRIMLALKNTEIKMSGRNKNLLPQYKTLIFDEIDTGIGGAVAQEIGKKLRTISNDYQVLCITHLPQIAAQGNNHLRVDKLMLDNSVDVSVKEVSSIERQNEIARMISGKITKSSLQHAKELLNNKS